MISRSSSCCFKYFLLWFMGDFLSLNLNKTWQASETRIKKTQVYEQNIRLVKGTIGFINTDMKIDRFSKLEWSLKSGMHRDFNQYIEYSCVYCIF